MNIKPAFLVVGSLLLAGATTVVNNAINKYLDKPAFFHAEVVRVPHVQLVAQPGHKLLREEISDFIRSHSPGKTLVFPESIEKKLEELERAQLAAEAECLHIVNLINESQRPFKEIKIVAENSVAYNDITESLRYSRKSKVSNNRTLTVDVLAPGERKKIAIYTTKDCYNEYGWHDKIRIFNNDGSANLTEIELPQGFLQLINQYWILAAGLLFVGAFTTFIVVVGLGAALMELMGITKQPQAVPQSASGDNDSKTNSAKSKKNTKTPNR